MGSLTIRHATLYTPFVRLEDAYVTISNGTIVSVGREPARDVTGDQVDARGLIVAPGLIDTHIHGVAGRDASEGSPEALEVMARALARHGVTSFIPTTVSMPLEGVERACKAVEDFMASWRPTGARPLGIHLEGPYISPVRAGAHDRSALRLPGPGEVVELMDSCKPLREITIAPELPGALRSIAFLARRGVVVQVGHTDADYRTVIDALAAGATKVTHLYDAMRGFNHRDPGPVAAALSTEGIYVELIADLVHVSPEALGLAIRAAGPHRVVLVSDAIAAADMPDGVYRLGGLEVEVRDGVARLAGSNTIAGSTSLLDKDLRNVASLGLDLGQAIAMATANPARSIGADFREMVGVIRPGMRGDLVVLDRDLTVVATIIEGEVAYSVPRPS